MLYTYRIERFNGVEYVIQEHYRKRIPTQEDSDRFQLFKETYLEFLSGKLETDDMLYGYFSEYIAAHGIWNFDEVRDIEDAKSVFREIYQIPVMETFPCCVVRGAVIDNKVVELQCSYVNSVLPGEVENDIHRFYGLFDSIHWRNTISYQRDKMYGCLFEPSDFEKAGTE